MNKFNFLVSMCFAAILVFTPTITIGQANPLIVPFGGLVTAWRPCKCSGNTLLYVTDFRTNTELQIMYQPFFSRLNQQFNLLVPAVIDVLGTYYSFGICLDPGYPCEEFGAPNGTITSWPFSGVGTSAE